MRKGTRRYSAPHVVVIRTSTPSLSDPTSDPPPWTRPRWLIGSQSTDLSGSMRRRSPEQARRAWYVTVLGRDAVDPARRQSLASGPKPHWTRPIGIQADLHHRRQVRRPGNGGAAGCAVER